MLYRHGDVLIALVPALPRRAHRQPGLTLAHGEVTGHSHRVHEADAARLWSEAGQTFLEVLAPGATIIHEEHRAMFLSPGIYHVWRQREYAPEAARWVED